MKILFYFTIFFSTFGANFLNFSVGPYQMSPYRALLMISTFLLIYLKMKNKEKLILSRNLNQKYSVVFFIIWFAYALITIAWARDITNWIRILYFLIAGVIGIILSVNIIDSFDVVCKSLVALNLGIMVQSCIGWYEIITKDYRFIELSEKAINTYVYGNSRIPIAMLGNPNGFATLMFLGTFISFGIFLISNNLFVKMLSIVLGVNDITQLMFTQSRANIIGIIIGIATIMLIRNYSKARIVILILCIITCIIYLPDIQKILTFNFNGKGSDEIRINLIKNGFRFLIYTFGFGVGNGQIESWMETDAIGFTAHITNMHNWWMEILTAYGIIIFVGYVVFYIKMFLLFKNNIELSNDTAEKGVSCCLCAMICGFFISSVSSSSNMTNEWLWMFWAICIGYQGLLENEKLVINN